jgi:hypothetical protein
MVAADDDSTSRFPEPNVAWNDLPPKRRRFYFWLIISWLVLPLGRIPLEMAGLSSFVAAWIICQWPVVSAHGRPLKVPAGGQ